MGQLSLIFDMDDTLYARKDPFCAAVAQFVSDDRPDYRPAFEAADPDALFHAFLVYGYDLYEASMQGEVSMEEMYVYRMGHALKDFGMPVSETEALKVQEYYLWHQQHIQLDPCIREALDVCRENGVFLAVISNGKSDHQRDKYRAMGLEEYVPSGQFMASGDIGVSKPDPIIFQAAIKAWNIEADAAWYIGDSYSHDILGAAPFGWHTIWLNRDRKEADGRVIPDYVVHTSAQLRDVLLEIVGRACSDPV